jgi:hypothetical protein
MALIQLTSIPGKGWFAVFYGCCTKAGLTMPDRVSIPLPFTSAAPFETVKSDLAAHYPKARIERQHTHGAY